MEEAGQPTGNFEVVYSICFMCSVRCPIKVYVRDNEIFWIEGNPHAGINGALCPRGGGGLALLNDPERLQYPMIRTGPRGSGEWRRASWQEALQLVADRLQEIIQHYGSESVIWAERANLMTHVSKAFLRAIGSPNYISHDALCKGSVNSACRSLFGRTDAEFGIDYANTQHIVFQGRNFFEAIEVKPCQDLLKAVGKGAKITYIDPRVTVTATKAHQYIQIRPGTDLAFNYALIRTLLVENLYDRDFVKRWVLGLEELRAFVEPYTPEWAAEECGVEPEVIVGLARELSAKKPHVVVHYGYRGANHTNEIYHRRSIMIINSLLGAIEAKGGVFIKKGPGDFGVPGVRKFVDQEFPPVDAPRFDGCGTRKWPIPDCKHGIPQMLPESILKEDPYPIKALIVFRLDPLQSIPNYYEVKQALEKLDLIVAIDVNMSETAWMADVILPESIYLERTDPVQQKSGLKLQLVLRKKCVTPRYDTRPGWLITKQIAERMGLGKYFPYNDERGMLEFMLEPTGVKIEDFEDTGIVPLVDSPLWWDRKNGIKFKTPSGKIEFVSSLLEDNGIPSFPPYQPVRSPENSSLRLIVGRCALHTHVATQNNPLLHEMFPENVLWIHPEAAARSGIKNGEMVEVYSEQGSETIKAFVTPQIHPEAVFMVHGFGRKVPVQTRCYQRGAMDTVLMKNVSDEVGGSPGLHETFVHVRPLNSNGSGGHAS